MMVHDSGGLELLFSNKRKHSINIPKANENHEPVNIRDLIAYLCENVMKEPRGEMFVLDGTV